MAFRMLSASRRIGRGGLNFFLFASFDDDCNHTSDAIQLSRLSCTDILLFVARNDENCIWDFVSTQYISHYRSLMCIDYLRSLGTHRTHLHGIFFYGNSWFLRFIARLWFLATKRVSQSRTLCKRRGDLTALPNNLEPLLAPN